MILELKNVSRSFGEKDERITVLKDISLIMRQGEFIALSGESGTGKTTLLGIISLNDTYSGGLFIDGKNAAEMPGSEKSAIKNKKIGILCQNYNLLPDLTIRENILLPLKYAAKGSKSVSCEELAGFLGIKDKLEQYPGTLSGGEKQRAALARALICSPELLIADEPARNLDAENAAKLMELFKTLAAKGMTVLMSSHDEDISSQACRHILLENGILREIPSAIQPENAEKLPPEAKKEGKNAENAVFLPEIAQNYQKMPIKRLFLRSFSYLLRHKAKAAITFLLLTATIIMSFVSYALFIGDDFSRIIKLVKEPRQMPEDIAEIALDKDKSVVGYSDALKFFPEDSIARQGYVKRIIFPGDTPVQGGKAADIPQDIEFITFPQWWISIKLKQPENLTFLPDGMAVYTTAAMAALAKKDSSFASEIVIAGRHFFAKKPIYAHDLFHSGESKKKAVIFADKAFDGIPHKEEMLQLVIQTRDSSQGQPLAQFRNYAYEKGQGSLDGIHLSDWKEESRQLSFYINVFIALMLIIFGVPLALCGIGLLVLMLAGLKEKTREIAIRKMLGMTDFSAFMGCIKESIALSTLGCLFGGVSGFIISDVLIILLLIEEKVSAAEFMEALKEIIQATIRFVPHAFGIIFAVIIIISLISGIIPAIKTKRISPMEALKD